MRQGVRAYLALALLAFSFLTLSAGSSLAQTFIIDSTRFEAIDGAQRIANNADVTLSFISREGRTFRVVEGLFAVLDGRAYLRDDVHARLFKANVRSLIDPAPHSQASNFSSLGTKSCPL